MNRRRFFVAVLVLLLAGRCNKTLPLKPIVKQSETTAYHNQEIGFTIVMPGDWQVFTNPAEMPGDLKANFNALQAAGLTVQMIALKRPVGSRPGGFRITSQSFGMANTEYTEATIKANAGEIGRVSYSSRKLAGVDALFWSGGKGAVQYAEYVVRIGGHNLRFTFWGPDKSTSEASARRVMAGLKIALRPSP